MIVTFFDVTGRFLQVLEGDFNLVIEPTAATLAMPYIEGHYSYEDWLENGTVQKRPACPASLNGTTLHDVPANSTIAINDQTYDCEDGGTVELEFDQPGTYHVRITCWPYLDGEFIYENPAH